MKLPNPVKRVLAFVLALVMVFGMMPVHAHAAGDQPIDAAVIFSDLHTSKSNYKESIIKEFFTMLKNTGLPISQVISAGDAFSVNEDSGKYTGDTAKITAAIRSGLGNNSMPVHYVWSDHDRYGTGIDKNSGFVYGAGSDGIYGTADDANYYVYSLSMADLSTNDRYKAGFHSNSAITATIAEFVADAAKLDQSKPLFIASHQPLFDRRDDNGHALEWCTAINQVAQNMDVAFFFGHNHRYDKAEDYFYAKGSTMPVTTTSLGSQNVVLNFTHMCAGYMEPTSTGSTSSTTRSGVLMVIEIHEDSIRYTTYNKSGKYTGNYAVDKYVTRDHAVTEPELLVSGSQSYFVGEDLNITVSLKTGSKVENVTAAASVTGFDMQAAGDQVVTVSYAGLTAQYLIRVRQKTFLDAATGVALEVSVPGATAMTVAPADADVGPMLTGYAGYDIRLSGYTKGDGALVTLPVPNGVTDPAVCFVDENGTVVKVAANVSSDGKYVTFSTDAFGIFLVGQEGITEALENTVIGGGTTYEEKTVYVRVNSFVSGGKYLIIGESKVSNGDKIAYLNNSGSEGWTTVQINTGSVTTESGTYSNGYIELDNANAVWTATGASAGVTLSNNGRYIGGTDANTLKSSSSEAAKVTYDSSKTRLKTASGTTRYLYYSTYNNENWKWSTSSSSSTSSRNMWIYQEETIRVQVSAPVVYTLQASALHHVLTDYTAQLQFNLLADGAVAQLPSDSRFSFQVVGDTSGIIAAISDQGTVTFNKAEGSCYVKISCTWSEGTVYKYVRVTAEADPNACDHVYTAETVAATCTQDGCTVYTCVCGDSYTEVIPALGHDYKAVVTAPTCMGGGYTTYTCHCGDSYIADHVAALGHQYQAVVTAPTCENAGFTTYTCHCGDSYVADQVAALGHDYESVTTEATCTEDGSIVYTCHCGDTYTQILPALGHDYKAVVTAPTCENMGFTTYTCACGDSYVADEVAALGHKYEAVVTAPTCEDAGYTTYTCACGHSYTADQVAALGHDHKSVTTEATCTEDGSIVYTCHCGDTYTQILPALGHDAEAVITAPTCETEGYTTHTCRRCGDVTVDAVVAALGHDYEKVTVDPTCTETGSVTETCLRCGESHTEVIPAAGHSHEAVVTAPTCENAGYTTYTCHCGDSYIADEVAALGHDYKSVTTEATCTEAGSIVYTCRCGETYTEVIPALGHKYEAVVTAPTCEEAGYTTYTCVCGDSYITDEVAALGHKYEAVVTAPTCEEAGFTTYTCHCGDSYIADEVAALGHDYKSVTTAATCTEDGSIVHTCHCGDTYTEVIPALGHDYEAVVTAPTCEEAGFTTYTCHCGDSYIADEVAALGHDYKSVTTAATCTEDGSIVYTCHCGDTYTEVIPALGHKYETVVTAPTCTEAGYTTYTCHCGDSYVADKVAALGHDYESVTTEATCTEDGSTVYTCRCGETYTEVIPAPGHDYEAVVTAPTCEEAGYTTYTCACGDSYIADEIAALGHKYEALVTAPTCEKAGFTTYTCHCGDSYIADEVAALGHSYQSVTTAATCTEDGSIVYTCRCGKTYTEVIPALGHKYETVVTAPTCENAGFTTYTCHCGDSYTANATAALGHSYETQEQNGVLIHTCGSCGHSYTESVAWIPVGSGYVLDTDGIDVGSEHKYIVVGATKDYALTVNGTSVSATAVTIRNNTLIVDDASKMELWFADNGSRERNTYLLTQDGSRSVYHVSGNINYGHDSKGYWYFGSSSNGLYQLYDKDGQSWYLNYGYVWSNQSANRFAVSSKAQSVRLFKQTDSYARLTGSLIQTVEDTDNAAVAAILEKIAIQLSANGADVTGTAAVTADMLTWNVPFDGTMAGTYTAEVTYEGVKLGTVTVHVTTKHSYVTTVVAPTCESQGYTERKCSECGVSHKFDYTAALGHSYTHADANGYRTYTCVRCGDSYSEKLSFTYSQVSAFTSGERFVITVKSGSKYYALSHSGNNISAVQVTVSGGKITSQITEDLLWSYEDGKLSYVSGDETHYLYTYTSGWWGMTTNLGISTDDPGAISLSSGKLKIDSKYLRYSGSKFSVSSSGTTVYLFQEK